MNAIIFKLVRGREIAVIRLIQGIERKTQKLPECIEFDRMLKDIFRISHKLQTTDPAMSDNHDCHLRSFQKSLLTGHITDKICTSNWTHHQNFIKSTWGGGLDGSMIKSAWWSFARAEFSS